jgi:hypothetical protein
MKRLKRPKKATAILLEASYDLKSPFQSCGNDFTAYFRHCNFAGTILRPVFLIAILQERFYDLFFPLQFCRRLFTSEKASRNFARTLLAW